MKLDKEHWKEVFEPILLVLAVGTVVAGWLAGFIWLMNFLSNSSSGCP